jgi:N-glycosylase/DNA lyase
MNELIKQIKKLQKNEIGTLVQTKLNEFNEIQKQGDDIWFSELCFCLLAYSSKARNSLKIQKELGVKKLLEAPLNEIRECIVKNHHRFHNTKARFIVEARQFMPIKQRILEYIKNNKDPREFLVNNINGFGYKEGSHYLRNVGFLDYAILDRHILFLMKEHGLIDQIPKSPGKRLYLEIEKKFIHICKKLKMKPGEVDLYMWYMRTNDLVK